MEKGGKDLEISRIIRWERRQAERVEIKSKETKEYRARRDMLDEGLARLI